MTVQLASRLVSHPSKCAQRSFLLSAEFTAIGAVTHEATSSYEFAPFVEGRNPITRRKLDESLADHLGKQNCP